MGHSFIGKFYGRSFFSRLSQHGVCKNLIELRSCRNTRPPRIGCTKKRESSFSIRKSRTARTLRYPQCIRYPIHVCTVAVCMVGTRCGRRRRVPREGKQFQVIQFPLFVCNPYLSCLTLLCSSEDRIRGALAKFCKSRTASFQGRIDTFFTATRTVTSQPSAAKRQAIEEKNNKKGNKGKKQPPAKRPK